MDIRQLLQKKTVIADGAMGTMLHKRAPENAGTLSELLNSENPEAVIGILTDYLKAGADYIVTNSFGANPFKYDDEKLDAIICASLKTAREAQRRAGVSDRTFVGLDIGPSGKLLKPLGDLPFEDAVQAFKKTCEIGVKYGADFINIATFTDLYETKAAVVGAKEACDLPIFVTNAYSENGKLLTGADPLTVITTLEGLGVTALGINCSFGPDKSLPIIEEYLKYAHVPVIFKPNAGLPDKDGNYDLTVEKFAEIVLSTVKKGAGVIGGCCGTTPEHIQSISGVKGKPVKRKVSAYTAVSSGRTTKILGDGGLTVIGERLNPTGKKRLKQAITEKDFDYIIDEGEKQVEQGADILDVNVGLPGICESEMLLNVVTELQANVGVPLQIDTSDPTALEKALREYNGKPLINSVNGKKESMDAVFPLAKKYGGVVVCLLLDENGIPSTVKGRLSIAKKIIREAEKYGISKDELIFDPLCLSIATDNKAGVVTAECVKKLYKMRLKTVLGVSNVSYGLPERDRINATFLHIAAENGLTAGIINPFMKKDVDRLAFDAILGLDEKCEKYIASTGRDNEKSGTEDVSRDDLVSAITKGRKQLAGKLTAELLKTKKPIDLINEYVIPALDKVGENYEKNIIFLPQLLSSAEAAGASFEVIKSTQSESETQKKGKFVIATVKGDIHDIGKNIVKMLLENYGFEVIDLGKDVPPEKVLEACIETGARVVGLSALMTTTLRSMKETTELLKKEIPDVKICVGGAVLTKEYAEEIGADKYAGDAMETVAWAETVI